MILNSDPDITVNQQLQFTLKHILYSASCCSVQQVCNSECNDEHKSLKKALWRSENRKQTTSGNRKCHPLCIGRNVVVKYYDKEKNNELDSNTELMKKLILL